jgi:hypothetical protein
MGTAFFTAEWSRVDPAALGASHPAGTASDKPMDVFNKTQETAAGLSPCRLFGLRE